MRAFCSEFYLQKPLARARPGHPRLDATAMSAKKTWVAGPSPATGIRWGCTGSWPHNPFRFPGQPCAFAGMTGCSRREPAAFGGQPLHQGRRPQRLVPRPVGVVGQPIAEAGEPQPIGIIHRAAAPHRPAIPADPNHVDVAGARRNTLFKNAGPFVDHGEYHALDDLLLADRPPVEAEPCRLRQNDRFDLGIGHRGARSGIIPE